MSQGKFLGQRPKGKGLKPLVLPLSPALPPEGGGGSVPAPLVLTRTTPVDIIEEGLVVVPEGLALARYSRTDLRVDPALVPALERFHRVMVEMHGGREDGRLVVNSCYRRRGTTCEDDENGEVDKSDINGHWAGCAVDFSAEQTAIRYYGTGAGRGRDAVRAALYTAGFRFPWYYRADGSIHEHWHVAIEERTWAQRRAFRGEPPPWYA